MEITAGSTQSANGRRMIGLGMPALCIVLGAAVLTLVGRPLDRDPLLIGLGAMLVVEVLLIDFPDRRHVSTIALPAVLIAAASQLGTLVWAVAIASTIAALLRLQPPTQIAFVFARSGISATVGYAIATAALPGALGAVEPLVSLPAALLFVGTFAGCAELLTLVERRYLAGGQPSRIDLIVSICLVPLAVLTWAFAERIGETGLMAAGGGLIALLAVVRSAVNTSTSHADLRQLYELSLRVQQSASPGASLRDLAAGLRRVVRFEQIVLALPSSDIPWRLHSVGEALIGLDGATLWPALDTLAGSGPAVVPPETLPHTHGVHVVAARYGRAGVLLVARRRGEFSAHERAVLGLVLGQLSSALEQVRSLDAVARDRERLAALLNYSGEGIFVVDRDGKLSRINRALERLTATREADVVDRPLQDALAISDASGAHLSDAIAGVAPGETLTVDGTLTTAHGEQREILLSYTAIPESAGGRGGIGIIRDVTEIVRVQREREQFLDVMTHDLKSPLAGILGYAQMLEGVLAAGEDLERARRYAERIRTGGNQMLRMIENLLTIARMESGRIELEVDDVDLLDEVEQILQVLEPQTMEKALTISVDMSPILLRTSSTLLRESLANVIGNAIKYTPTGGSVTIAAQCQADNVQLSVSDTGYGIPADALPRLFERFFRTSQPEVRELRGSGLGLALTKMMVERLGGTIAVESELGRGTTFTITLPVQLGEQPR